jgi:hypothetical protein
MKLLAAYAFTKTIGLEFRSKGDEEHHIDNLEDERHLHQGVSNILLGFGYLEIGNPDSTACGQRLDNPSEGKKGGDDAARVDG